MMLFKSFLVWVLIIPLAILNGILREKVLSPWLGPEVALPASGVLLCMLILVVAAWILPHLVQGTAKQFWRIGLFWLVLTVVFETAFGLLAGHSAQQLLAAYNLTTGNLWSLVILFTTVAPWLGAKIRGVI